MSLLIGAGVRIRLAIALLTPILAWQTCQAQEPSKAAKHTPTGAEVELGRRLLQNYERNRKQVSRYACAMFVDKTNEDFETPQNTSHAQDWYFHSCDLPKNLSRHDGLVLRSGFMSYLPNEPELSVEDDPQTSFLTEQEVIQVNDFMSNNSVTLKNSKEEDFEALRPQVGAYPWEFPFWGSSVTDLQPRSNDIRRKTFLDDNLNEIRILGAEEIGRLTGVEFELLGRSEAYWKAIFDKESGDMPVRVERIAREDKYFGIQSIVETDWIFANKAWIPQRVDLEQKLGPPQEPVGFSSHRTDLYWVLGDNVSEEVFVTSPPDVMRPAELKQMILRFAINRQ